MLGLPHPMEKFFVCLSLLFDDRKIHEHVIVLFASLESLSLFSLGGGFVSKITKFITKSDQRYTHT